MKATEQYFALVLLASIFRMLQFSNITEGSPGSKGLKITYIGDSIFKRKSGLHDVYINYYCWISFTNKHVYIRGGGGGAGSGLWSCRVWGLHDCTSKEICQSFKNHTEHARNKYFISVSAPYWIFWFTGEQKMCTKLQLNVDLFPVICCLMEVNTFCGRTRLKIVSSVYFNVEIFRRITSSDHGF